MAPAAISSWQASCGSMITHHHSHHNKLPFCSSSIKPSLAKIKLLQAQGYVNHKYTRLQATASSSSSSSVSEAAKLSSISILTTDGVRVQFKDLWNQNSETAVVAFLRHFGCPFCWEFAASLRDLKPQFDAAGVKLIAIGVGTPDKAQILAEKLPFPKEALFADPERKAYDALGLYYGFGRTFFNPASAKILGRLDAVQKATKDYTLEATPYDRASVLQQGGLYVFKGKQLVFARKDEGTGDHASLDDVLNACCSPALV